MSRWRSDLERRLVATFTEDDTTLRLYFHPERMDTPYCVEGRNWGDNQWYPTQAAAEAAISLRLQFLDDRDDPLDIIDE